MKLLRPMTKVLTLALVLALTLVLASCGGLELKSFTVDRTTIKTSYFVGEALDFSGIKAVAKYSDSDLDKEYTYEELTISYGDGETAETITQTVGKKNIVVSFVDPNFSKETVQSTTVMIEVKKDPNAPQHDSYTIDSTGVKKDYYVGDAIDLSGLVVTEHFKNAADKVVDATEHIIKYEGTLTADTITATKGNKHIYVYVGSELAGTITISVTYPAVESVTSNVDDLDTDFELNDVLDFSSLVATITYANGDTATVTYGDMTFSVDLTTVTANAGTRTIYAYFDDPVDPDLPRHSITIAVTVQGEAVTVENKEVLTDGVTLSFYQYNTIDLSGISVHVTYSDGSEATITYEDITFLTDLAVISKTAGTHTVQIKWLDATVGYEVTAEVGVEVKENRLVSSAVDGVDLVYTQGDAVDFSGILVTLVYTDGTTKTLAFADLAFVEDPANLTNGTGSKTVVANYTDPLTGKSSTLSFGITVNEPLKQVTSFEKTEAITAFESAKKNANKALYGESGFSGQFADGTALYAIGDDNEFKFAPVLKVKKVENNITSVETLYYFYSTVSVSLYDEEAGAYVALTPKTTDKATIVEYLSGETLMVTVDTYNNTYDFADAAVGAQVKISVLPDATKYAAASGVTLAAVELEAKVVDAYNVYSAKELSLFDNDATDHNWHTSSDAAVTWEQFKLDNGLNGITVNGLVLHSDLSLTASDVPAEFFYITDKDITYYDGSAEKVIPAGTKYLRDCSEIYRRVGETDNFLFEGNYFTITTANFPLVPSDAVFGDTTNAKGYGSDFSNSTLFRVGVDGQGSKGGTALFQNLSIIGNAGRNNITDADGKLVSAGGLIFIKASYYANVTCKNMIGNSYFIAYFPEYHATLNLEDVKFYDAYQNGIMGYDTCTLNVKDSYFNGAGGPVVILQSVDPTATTASVPVMNATNSVFETHLVGDELWFSAVNASGIIGQIQALSQGLAGANIGSLFDKSGKMSIEALLMASGTDASAVVLNAYTQGTMFVDEDGINRVLTDAQWQAILQNANFQGGAPFLTVVNGEEATTIYVIPPAEGVAGGMFNAETGQAIGAEEVMAFMAADKVVLSQGGISVLFELYNADGSVKAVTNE